jgi:hypothetical protein
MVWTIVLKPGPTQQVDPRLELGRVEEKMEEEKTRCDLADLADWPGDMVDSTRPGQKLGCNPLTFVFFTKTISFWLKKNWLMQPDKNSKSGSWTEPGLKIMVWTGQLRHNVRVNALVSTLVNIYAFTGSFIEPHSLLTSNKSTNGIV